jgi:kumamolisin
MVDFALVLRMPGERRIAAFLRDVNNPGSPRYRRFLSAWQFGRRFGLRQSVIAQARAELRTRGLRVTRAFPQRTELEVRGSARALRRVFRVNLGEYRDRDGRRFHAPLSRPVVPQALSRAITGVAGLNTKPLPEKSLQGPNERGFFPKELARAYGFDKLWKSGIRGQGQSIAVYTASTFNDDDVARYDEATGTPGPHVCSSSARTGCVEHVPVHGGVEDTDPEDALDVETIHGIAPGATVLNYESKIGDASSASEYGKAFATSIAEVANQVVQDNRAHILSISYGLAEGGQFNGEQILTPEDRQIGERAFQQAVAHGVNIFVSSGDQGAYQCQQFDAADHRLCVAWPTDSPNVISVGGTLLDVDKQGDYVEEAGWQDTLSAWGGGGGVSSHESRPSWQSGSVAGVENKYSNGKRQVPDVSGPASQASGIFVVYNGDGQPVGGTSASSPFWAAIAALITEQAQKQGAGKLPFLNPIFYRLAGSTQRSVFHDVERGGNRYYPATPGWDYATGLGSPMVDRLAPAIIREVKR